MIQNMNLLHKTRQRYVLAAVFLAVWLTPLLTFAASDEDIALKEARFEGYGQGVTVHLEGAGSAGGTWVVFILLAIVGLAVLFKNSKRTHLD
jgi:hypothetical protein